VLAPRAHRQGISPRHFIRLTTGFGLELPAPILFAANPHFNIEHARRPAGDNIADRLRSCFPSLIKSSSESNRTRWRAKNAKGAFAFPAKGDSTKPIGSVRKAHDAAVENAGIKDHFKLYDLRHTFATRSVAAGVDLPTLSAILGHTSIQMTMRYVHPAEEQKRFAAGKLETFRQAGILQAIEEARQASTISATVQ